ncbi:FAST kinase domain-containing protein 5, mitochondrial isoform X2 [Halyomorpha halys]|uniref:FAST kinase domain-containing protein 5, mitochondrial isoform X2 n=1 Tax=Halyomorpha halys TaxID=286706 RepID=UPI0006D5243D|nr:uncharacterized protein LOC106684881 isoform X2 [Halyomorpha halys]
MSILRRITFLKNYLNAVPQITDFYIKSKAYPYVTKWVISHQCYCNGQFIPYKNPAYPKENTFSHGIMENISAYNMTVCNLSKDPAYVSQGNILIDKHRKNSDPFNITVQELLSLFETICHLEDQDSDEVFKVFDAVQKRCHEMDDDQLASVLGSLKYSTVFESYKNDKLTCFWKELDNICIKRWKTWPVQKVFYFIDLWYCLSLLKRSNFVFVSSIRYFNKPQRLSPQQVVQLLFYLNVMRHPTNVSMYKLEYQLEACIENLSIEEIGVAVMGFFKTQNFIRSEKIMNHIIDKTISEIKSVPEITLACILKAFRYSMTIPLWRRIPELLNAVEQELPRLTIQCSVHASLLTTRPQIVHEGVLRKVSQKLVDNITTCRLKDMEKAVFPLAQENFDPKTEPCIYKAILNELIKDERKNEMEQHPKTLIALVHYLCLKGIYVQHLIEKVLDMEFVYHTYGKNKYIYGRELLYIDTTMELECPSYNGPRLPTDIRNYLSKRYAKGIPDPNKKKMSKHQFWHLEIKETAEAVFGKDYVVEKYLLPNHPRAGTRVVPLL